MEGKKLVLNFWNYLNLRIRNRLSLKSKMILFICFLVAGMLFSLGIFANHIISETLEDQIGKRALNVAKSVSLMPEIRKAFELEDPSSIIQPIVESIRVATGAEFIVVGNMESIRYSHSIPERLGQEMVGGDNERALLHGESYVSKATGSLGPSLRGKVPIFSEEGEIIGIVSVGFLIDHIETITGKYKKEVWIIVMVFITIGILGAIFIATHFKKEILGLEPEEIAHLFKEKETILQSIHEGIIAINRKGEITMINHAAQKLLTERDSFDPSKGQHIRDIFPNTKMLEVLDSGTSQYDHEMLIGRNVVIVNRVPIFYDGQVIGVVASFRNKSEIDRLTQELSRIKQYTEALRAQTHEFSNKLYTISGLLQLNKVQEAIELIIRESKVHQDWIRLLIEKVPDPMISAVILGKLNRAHELGVTMVIDPESSLSYITTKDQAALLTILGNLLENSIEAAAANQGRKPVIRIFLTDIGHDIIFEIEDSGEGVPDQWLEKIFQDGFTTKTGSHRGIGLALVNQAVKELKGHITVEQGEFGGACFIAAIPKYKQEVNDHV